MTIVVNPAERALAMDRYIGRLVADAKRCCPQCGHKLPPATRDGSGSGMGGVHSPSSALVRALRGGLGRSAMGG